MLETAYKILTDFFIRSQIMRLFFMLSILSWEGFVFGRWGLMRKNEHRDLLQPVRTVIANSYHLLAPFQCAFISDFRGSGSLRKYVR